MGQGLSDLTRFAHKLRYQDRMVSLSPCSFLSLLVGFCKLREAKHNLQQPVNPKPVPGGEWTMSPVRLHISDAAPARHAQVALLGLGAPPGIADCLSVPRKLWCCCCANASRIWQAVLVGFVQQLCNARHGWGLKR